MWLAVKYKQLPSNEEMPIAPSQACQVRTGLCKDLSKHNHDKRIILWRRGGIDYTYQTVNLGFAGLNPVVSANLD